MSAKAILIRAVQLIESDGFVSGDQALVKGTSSTAQSVLNSLDKQDITEDELLTYGPWADNVLGWITKAPLDGDKFLINCRTAVDVADTSPHKVAGFLVCLPAAFLKHLSDSKGLDLVTMMNSFAADAGESYTGTGTIINIQKVRKFYKISVVDDNGYYISYTIGAAKNTLLPVAVDDKISISGKAYRNKFSTPFETSLVNTTIEKL